MAYWSLVDCISAKSPNTETLRNRVRSVAGNSLLRAKIIAIKVEGEFGHFEIGYTQPTDS